MDKSVKITGMIVGGVLLIVLLSIWTIFQLSPATNTVGVSGTSKVTATPDLMTLNLNVESKAKTAQEAQSLNLEKYDAVVKALVAIGIDEKDIGTTGMSVYEDYDWTSGTRKSLGYVAQHNLRIELGVGESIKMVDAIEAGVNAGAMLSYINFELSTDLQNEYKAEAIRLATLDARTKAEAMADGLGKNLGKVVSVSDSSYSYSPWNVYDARETSAGAVALEDAKAVVANIQPSEQDIYGNVQVVYRIS